MLRADITAAPPRNIGVPLHIANIQKIYETAEGAEVEAVRGFSVSIAAGEFVAIVGPSGCGKSTVLSMVAGLEPPTSGQIRIDNAVLKGPDPRAGMVFQSDLLLPWRTILDNVLLTVEVKKLRRADYAERAEQLLHKVGLGGFASKFPHELSGGMRQRAAICRAIIQEPGLLLMDEPFGALDALTREQMIMDLQALWLNLGNTVLFITHDIEEAVFLADRVLVMSPRPGRVELELKIDLPRPRRRTGINLERTFNEAVSLIRSTFEAQGVFAVP